MGTSAERKVSTTCNVVSSSLWRDYHVLYSQARRELSSLESINEGQGKPQNCAHTPTDRVLVMGVGNVSIRFH